MSIKGKIVGYDPGGNDKHGVAALIVDNGRPVQLSFKTVRNAQAAFDWFTIGEIPLAAGNRPVHGRQRMETCGPLAAWEVYTSEEQHSQSELPSGFYGIERTCYDGFSSGGVRGGFDFRNAPEGALLPS